jgi:hypothetical protein
MNATSVAYNVDTVQITGVGGTGKKLFTCNDTDIYEHSTSAPNITLWFKQDVLNDPTDHMRDIGGTYTRLYVAADQEFSTDNDLHEIDVQTLLVLNSGEGNFRVENGVGGTKG